MIALRNVLKRAVDDGTDSAIADRGLAADENDRAKRPLFESAELERLCEAAFETRKNEAGETVPVTRTLKEFVDYIKLLAYSGARRNEALGLRWPDVDFERAQLTIGASGDTKNRTSRVVDFNPKLNAHFLTCASDVPRIRNGCFRRRNGGKRTWVREVSKSRSSWFGIKPGCRGFISMIAAIILSAWPSCPAWIS